MTLLRIIQIFTLLFVAMVLVGCAHRSRNSGAWVQQPSTSEAVLIQ